MSQKERGEEKMKQVGQLFIGCFLLVLAGCNNRESVPIIADTIYLGGDIITMESDSATYVEAVAVKDRKIIFAGSQEDAEKMKGENTVVNNLQGKTLIPGNIDMDPEAFELDKKIAPYDALKKITGNATHQYSIKKGEFANLVILEQNPLKIDPAKMEDIKLIEIIKEGKTIYKK